MAMPSIRHPIINPQTRHILIVPTIPKTEILPQRPTPFPIPLHPVPDFRRITAIMADDALPPPHLNNGLVRLGIGRRSTGGVGEEVE